MKISEERVIVAVKAIFILTVITGIGLVWHSVNQFLAMIEGSPLLKMIID